MPHSRLSTGGRRSWISSAHGSFCERSTAFSHTQRISGFTSQPPSGRTPPHLFIGAVENPGAPPFEYRVDRALKKARAGARFLQLQLCFQTGLLERFIAEAVARGLAEQAALIPSICLVRSPSALRFVDEKVPGISVPAELIERCERAKDPEAECFEVGCELADHARSLPGVKGLHLISFRREAGIARLCARLGLPTRVERETSGNRSAVAV